MVQIPLIIFLIKKNPLKLYLKLYIKSELFVDENTNIILKVQAKFNLVYNLSYMLVLFFLRLLHVKGYSNHTVDINVLFLQSVFDQSDILTL